MDYQVRSNPFTRRRFLSLTGKAAAAFAIIPNVAFAGMLDEKKVRVAIVGGGFGSAFNFHEHPNCIVEAVSDLRQDRREKLMQVYKCSKSYESLEILLKDPKVEAVFIATPAPDHVRHTIATLNAGKHVLCAVPAAMTLEECHQLKNAVQRSGLTYMMAETTAYRQNTISVKKFYKEGAFGKIFSAAAEYNHPGLEDYFFDNQGKPTWRHGLPPMLYPTHCTSFLISVTGERLTHVSAMGWGDNNPKLQNNPYKNPFWNETAFFKTDRGTPFRVEVNWKGALRGAERGEWRGDKMSFFSALQEGGDHTIVRTADTLGHDDAGFKNKTNKVETYKQEFWWQTDMLPEPLRHNSGHGGSHTFITHEFIDALVKNRQPEVNIYEALAYTVPGIVAHQSALKNGEYMKIPNFDK
ncbi:Gfo/Idh/MocA family protein [Flavisolibacter ginsenosidimutans]|uniref:Gfo/Idh/MocA family oxidoreductase n=1 Tax=Flavisolibacter ginsenosidimutans TaxID=661481 RepID=A0A5B8UE64_9BACT|nr:Gfo/Idh/MocA family oxidoreductase [Flavisolibacter ginsenosidimutans]QEC54380.1 Gfo/Idh/MocA family oxidoreductase [Flavisolibacter ginsenosidimutans]